MRPSANRFFTLLFIPEKTSKVRRFVLPAWVLRTGVIAGAFLLGLFAIMIGNYAYVMSQVSENNQLKVENRRLRQQVQVFKTKMNTLEDSMDRVKTLSTRLKIITNVEDRGGVQSLMNTIPDSETNIGAAKVPSEVAAIEAELDPRDPETVELKRQYDELDQKLTTLTGQAMDMERTLQDQYESLSDQKAFLSALPTRRPATGYFTSGFGVRRAPFGGKVKMHEGLDIANHPGTPIYASANGTVSYADSKPGYGLIVIVDHGYGLETWYGHTRKVLVTRGQKVRRGEMIALLGNSGRSTGPHVHYEVRVNGTPVDPLSFILEN